MVLLDDAKSVSQQSTFKTDDGHVVNEPDKISNSFNDFFVINIGPKLASGIKHSGKDYFEYLLNPTQTSLFMKPIIAEEIVKIISKFNQNKSPGHDGIGNLIVKNVAHIVSRPLADIFNLSLSTGSVPEQLKIAKVIPIYKKENAEIFSNYRPVSVLPCFFENIRKIGF